MQKNTNNNQKLRIIFFWWFKEMFKRVSLSLINPHPPTPHTLTLIEESLECDQIPDSFFIFSYPQSFVKSWN